MHLKQAIKEAVSQRSWCSDQASEGTRGWGYYEKEADIYEKDLHAYEILREKLKRVKEENLSRRRVRERIKGVLNGEDIERVESKFEGLRLSGKEENLEKVQPGLRYGGLGWLHLCIFLIGASAGIVLGLISEAFAHPPDTASCKRFMYLRVFCESNQESYRL